MTSMITDPRDLFVLEAIETAILKVFRHERKLIDFDVDEALDALIADYRAEQQQHVSKPHRLGERAETIYSTVKSNCEWMLGRGEPVTKPTIGSQGTRSPEEIVAGLRKIKKSVALWTKEGGRQGYLNFIDQQVL